MRVAYVLPHFELYGGIKRALEIGNRLTRRGHEVCFYTPTGEPCKWRESNVPVKKLEDAGKDEYDVVLFTLEDQYREPNRFRTKSVVYYILHYGVVYKNADVCRESYRQPYYLIANSAWTASNVGREIGRVPPVVKGGIDTDFFKPVKVEKKYFVLSYGDKRRPWKGREDVEQLKPYFRIGFLADINPPQDKLPETYCSSQVFFSASWFEGWNWPALEAMACGVPLVITDDGGSREYAKDRYNCLVVPPRMPDKARLAIRKLILYPEMRDALVQNGLETAKNLTWDKSVTALEKHLELSLIGRGYA